MKPADLFTGSLVELLGESANVSVLTVTRTPHQWERWSERDDRFTQLLGPAATGRLLVVDFHGMSDKHGIDLCFGLGSNPSAVARAAVSSLTEVFADRRSAVGDPFPATADHTVTAHLQASGVPSIQVEISSRLRQPTRAPAADTAAFVTSLVGALRLIESTC
jgi:hypothetical protein